MARSARSIIVLALCGAAVLAPSAASAAPPARPDIALPTCAYDEGDRDPSLPTDCRPVMREAPLAPARYVGWAYLDLNHCPPGLACVAMYTMSTPAWSWTGSTWERTTIAEGQAYVSPYSGKWRWAWTRRSGWVAIANGRFELRRQ